MTERTKRKLIIEKFVDSEHTRIFIRAPDSFTNMRFAIKTVWRGKDHNACFTLHAEEILALEQFIADWKQERLRVKARNAQAAARRKATDPAPPS